jgi:hypothetical protein
MEADDLNSDETGGWLARDEAAAAADEVGEGVKFNREGDPEEEIREDDAVLGDDTIANEDSD